MADEIRRVESTESTRSNAVQNVSQYTKPETKKKEETAVKSETRTGDASTFSREASSNDTESAARNSSDISSQFRNSLWESVQNAKNGMGQSSQSRENERSSAIQDGTLRETSRDYDSTRSAMAGKLVEYDDTVRSQVRQGLEYRSSLTGYGQNGYRQPAYAGDEVDRKPADGAASQQIKDQTPQQMKDQMQKMKDQMQQMQQQIQTQQQMMHIQMQMMNQMMNMMNQMNGRNNGGANNGGMNPFGPINGNNGVNPFNNTNNFNNHNGISPANNTKPRQWRDLIGSWRQGAEGNCVSVATIKAAMNKYGDKVFKNTQRTQDGGYNVTLQDGRQVSVSANELALCNRMNRFVGSGPERSYANLCYAVMAKRALANRHEGARSLARACHSLNNGEVVDYPIKLLGLQNKYKRINLRDMKNYDSVITWNHNHCLYSNRGKVDGYGRPTSPSRWRLNGAYALL